MADGADLPEDGVDLVTLLTLEQDGEARFVSPHTDASGYRVFGGQVLAQALMAALATVDDGRPAHSLHAHFLRAGDGAVPIEYSVERLRDGRSFSTRQVTARQAGKVLLVATVSCHVTEKAGLEHQVPMPDVAQPESLRSETDIRLEALQRTDVEWLGPLVMSHHRAELRPVAPRDFAEPKVSPPHQHFWVRPIGAIPDDWRLRQGVLAYVSDMMLLSTALLPHGIYWATTAMDSASLDHALWFHALPDFDDWLLWSIETPWTGAARGLTQGRFFSREGTLLASAAQEGLLRLRT